MKGLEHIYENKLRELELLSLKIRLQGHLMAAFYDLKQATRKLDRDLLQRHVGQGGMVLN